MAATRFSLLALAVALLGATGARAGPSARIWGGEDAPSGMAPWTVSVRVDSTHKCVGSIIDAQYVLTAAHCVSSLGTTPVESSRVTTRVGSINQFAGGELVGVDAISIHPSYGNFLHDVAILRLSRALTWSDKVRQIALVDAEEDVADGATVATTGWGLTQSGSSPYRLQQLQLTTLARPECELQAGYGYESVLCLEHPVNEGTCKGDDGAGVYMGEYLSERLVGVVSFAFGACATKYPDVAARVSYYHDWIQSIVSQ